MARNGLCCRQLFPGSLPFARLLYLHCESLALYSLTYDLWNEIVDDAALAHMPLLEAMHQEAQKLQISAAQIEALKKKRELVIESVPWRFLLQIESYEDKIEGFRIFLVASEEAEVWEQVKAVVAADHGFSLEEIEGYELEHGLDLNEAIFEEIEESYGVLAEVSEDGVLFELVIFDSQDIDDRQISDAVWNGDDDAN
ncbi:Uncharacterised protein [uncultured archaeon]|nr:Uncharacterised protein [uncultured archaeon]